MSNFEFAVLPLERHRRAFEAALSALEPVRADQMLDLELIAEHLRSASSALERVIGRVGVDEVLGQIFSRLCVGK